MHPVQSDLMLHAPNFILSYSIQLKKINQINLLIDYDAPEINFMIEKFVPI